MKPSGTDRTAALIIAAGASERWGGRPKALLPVEGEPAVVRLVRICLAEGYEPVIVVTGPSTQQIRGALPSSGWTLAENRGWAAGRTGSVQAGLARLERETDVLLWPVDHPFVEAKTLRALEAASKRDQMAAWLIPTFLGANGHPVRWRGFVTGLVRDLPGSSPLRALLSQLGPQVARVAVDDQGVVENVDTPESYAQALRRFGGAQRS